MSDLDTIELDDGKGFDLRLKRTYRLLVDSLFKLLKEKSFDDISVIDLCDDAMINRATFYKHFNDKYEFVECIAKNTIQKMYTVNVVEKNLKNPIEIYHVIIERVIMFIDDNREIFRISLESNASGRLLNTLSDILYTYIRQLIQLTCLGDGDEIDGVPVDLITAFINGGAVHIIRWWLFEGSDYSAEQIKQYIEQIVFSLDTKKEEHMAFYEQNLRNRENGEI